MVPIQNLYENPPVSSNVLEVVVVVGDTPTHTHTHSDKQVGNPVSRLSFLESKLKIAYGEWALLISQEEFWFSFVAHLV
jgi:hypothetical protein